MKNRIRYSILWKNRLRFFFSNHGFVCPFIFGRTGSSLKHTGSSLLVQALFLASGGSSSVAVSMFLITVASFVQLGL